MALPGFSPDLGYGSGFKWGGRVWGPGDMQAFMRAIGPKRYSQWARNHSAAAQTFDPVAQQMLGLYKPQIDAINRQREMERQYYDRLSHNLGGFAAALGSLLGGGPSAMSGLYGNGANTMTAAGNAYGQQLNSDQAANAAADNSVLGAINSPAQVQGGDAGSVLAGVAGWLPSEMMGAQGKAWSDRMAHFPTEAALQANLMMKDLMAQAQSADAQYGGQISDLLSGMPNDRAKIEAQRTAMAQAQWKQQFDMLKFQADQAYKNYLIAKSNGQEKRANAYLKLAQQRTRDAELAAQGMNSGGGLLPGYAYDKNGNIVKVGKPSTSSSNPGSPAFRAKAVANVGKAQDKIQKDADKLLTGVVMPAMGPPNPTAAAKAKAAEAALWAKYKYLATTPTAAKALREEIHRIVYAERGPATAASGSGSSGSSLVDGLLGGHK